MSEAGEGSPEREWGFFLDDMIAFAEKVLSYTVGMNRAGFELDGLTYDATVRNQNRALFHSSLGAGMKPDFLSISCPAGPRTHCRKPLTVSLGGPRVTM